MTSARPGPARQQFERRFDVRRGHVIRVTYQSVNQVGTATGLYSRVSGTGWLHLKASDGASAIQVGRITDVKEVD